MYLCVQVIINTVKDSLAVLLYKSPKQVHILTQCVKIIIIIILR
jgi:hypothetical protein